MPSLKNQLKASILRKRGLGKGKYGKLVEPTISSEIPDRDKTLAMKLLEKQFSMPIELLLNPDAPIDKVARRLGIDRSTVSVWRLRLGLRGTLMDAKLDSIGLYADGTNREQVS